MLKLAHARALAVAVPTWCWLLLWLWPRAVLADSLSREFEQYDWLSLAHAGGLGLLGGFLALIYALAIDRRVVLQVLAEGGRNALVSPIAGAGAYVGIKAVAALGWVVVPTEPKFLLIIGAGWAGIAAIEWARSLAKDVMAGVRAWILSKGQQ